MPSQQMLEEEAERVQEYIHRDDELDAFITVGKLEEEQSIDKTEQLTEELQRIKDILVGSEGVDKTIRTSLEKYLSLESEDQLPPLSRYTGELSLINYDATLTWVDNRLLEAKSEQMQSSLIFLRAGINWVSDILTKLDKSKEEVYRLRENIERLQDSIREKAGQITFDDMLKCDQALVGYARAAHCDIEKINFIQRGQIRSPYAKTITLRELGNASVIDYVTVHLEKLLGDTDTSSTVVDYFAKSLSALDRLCHILEMLEHGEIKSEVFGDIDSAALRECSFNYDLCNKVESTAHDLLIMPVTDKFLKGALIEIDTFSEYMDDISSLKALPDKLLQTVSVNDEQVLVLLQQCNTTLSCIIEAFKHCVDNTNACIKFLTVKDDALLHLRLYVEDVFDAVHDE